MQAASRTRKGPGAPKPFLLYGRIMTMGLFIWQVVKAHVVTSPKYPETLHYRGDGVFMISGPSRSLRRQFKPKNL